MEDQEIEELKEDYERSARNLDFVDWLYNQGCGHYVGWRRYEQLKKETEEKRRKWLEKLKEMGKELEEED